VQEIKPHRLESCLNVPEGLSALHLEIIRAKRHLIRYVHGFSALNLNHVDFSVQFWQRIWVDGSDVCLGHHALQPRAMIDALPVLNWLKTSEKMNTRRCFFIKTTPFWTRFLISATCRA
jgi:hypothetical protein